MAPSIARSTRRNKSNAQGNGNARNSATNANKAITIQAYIPGYLRNFVKAYHGDFCYTPIFHSRLITQLMAEGFLPIATEGLLLPKLHKERCVIRLPQNLHVSKSTRKKAKKFTLSINAAFEAVVDGCKHQHGNHCWLYPELVDAFRQMHVASQSEADNVAFLCVAAGTAGAAANSSSSLQQQTQQQQIQVQCPVRLYSIEVWNATTGELAGGELGYTVGSIYTSLTGFSRQDSAGSAQLAALGRLLCQNGFSVWDLGMDMEYKQGLGCCLLSRDDYLEIVHRTRHVDGHLRLEIPTRPGTTTTTSSRNNQKRRVNAKTIIDNAYDEEALQHQEQSVDVSSTESPCKKAKSTSDNAR